MSVADSPTLCHRATQPPTPTARSHEQALLSREALQQAKGPKGYGSSRTDGTAGQLADVVRVPGTFVEWLPRAKGTAGVLLAGSGGGGAGRGGEGHRPRTQVTGSGARFANHRVFGPWPLSPSVALSSALTPADFISHLMPPGGCARACRGRDAGTGGRHPRPGREGLGGGGGHGHEPHEGVLEEVRDGLGVTGSME